MRRLAFALLCGLLAHANAQVLAFGVKAGGRATGDITGFPVVNPESKRYIIGPAIEVRVLPGVAVEVDALYRPFGYTLQYTTIAGPTTTRERANSWEFPLIAKYRFSEAKLHPFAGVGYVVRTVRGTDAYTGSTFVSLNPVVYRYYAGQSRTTYSATHGLVVSGGLDLGAKYLQVPLEFRYEHWTQPFLDQYGGDGSYHIRSAQNEAFVMLGLMWP